MVQNWLERLRDRGEDREKAVRMVRERAELEVREVLADYDAFAEAARAVRNGLLLGTATSSAGEEIPIRLSWGEEYCHWLVQGGTGTGKTTWIASILQQSLTAGRPVGVVDCKGDLFHTAIRWTAAVARTMKPAARELLRQRLVIVNPFSDKLVPLNVCRPLPGCSAEVQAYEITVAFSRLFDTGLGLHMENLLRHLLILLIEAELSLVEAPLVLQDDIVRGILAHRSTHPQVKEFFLRTYSSIPQVSKDALLSRLQGLLLPENLRLMLGADDCLDLRGVLERGDPLFVFLGKGPGIPEEQVEVLGSLFVQLLLQATYARGTNRGRPYLLAVDEFFHLLDAPALTRRFQTALTTARSFGLSMLLVNHNFGQLTPALRETILGNCDLMAVFRTSGRNAEFFGDFLPGIDPEVLAHARAQGRERPSRDEVRRHQLEALQRLPNRTLHWYDRRKPYRAIRLRVPDVGLPHVAAGTPVAEVEELLQREGWVRGCVAIPRTELRRQVEARQQRLRDLLRPRVEVTTKDWGREPAKPPSRRKKGQPRLG